jgi:hypothetical protein
VWVDRKEGSSTTIDDCEVKKKVAYEARKKQVICKREGTARELIEMECTAMA